jgi:hypothetical protein
MLLTEGLLGWLSRFKLIRLRRISLATLRRDGWRDGQRDGCQYMYCLPPAGGRIRSQGNKMRHRRNQRKLMRRRRNHEWAEVWVDRWAEGWI